MQNHIVKTHPDGTVLSREEQLAWKLAQLAAHNQATDADVIEMIGNRVIDNAAVALAAINRPPVRNARLLALGYPHPHNSGARLFGVANDRSFHCEWAALANGVAVRELDMHDTYLAADYSHPGDNIPGLLAAAQQTGANGRALTLGILTAYEVQMALVTGICLHEHKIDHVAHLAPAVAAGLGTMLQMPAEQIYQAINQSLHLACATRQSRKGDITSWKAYAPAQANKIAIEAVGRVRLGERAPSPIYEGRDAVIAYMLSGPDAEYRVPLPDPGENMRTILRSYTKEHSAEYQAQALIDLGFRLHAHHIDLDQVEDVIIRTSHHTHYVIGTGANDPQKMDPDASRETLDHSAMYILAVAWEDGAWHHVHSYTSERAHRPSTVALWHKIRTEEVAEWTQAYHHPDPRPQEVRCPSRGPPRRWHSDRRTPRQPQRPLPRQPPLCPARLHRQASRIDRGTRSASRERALSRTSGPVARSNARGSRPAQSRRSRGHVGRRQQPPRRHLIAHQFWSKSSPSVRATSAVTTRSLVTLTAVRHMSSRRSTARTMAMASTGRPTAGRISAIATKLAAGIPATPIDVSKASNTTIICSAMPKSMPDANAYTWAMNTTTTHSYSAVPSMFTVAPNGRTKLVTRSEIPACSALLIVTGKVAEDEAVENAVNCAGAILA